MTQHRSKRDSQQSDTKISKLSLMGKQEIISMILLLVYRTYVRKLYIIFRYTCRNPCLRAYIEDRHRNCIEIYSKAQIIEHLHDAYTYRTRDVHKSFASWIREFRFERKIRSAIVASLSQCAFYFTFVPLVSENRNIVIGRPRHSVIQYKTLRNFCFSRTSSHNFTDVL